MKNVLLVNSTGKNKIAINTIFDELKQAGYVFFTPGEWIYFGKIDNFWWTDIVFILCLPILYIYSLFFIIFSFYQQKINVIVCFNLPEKILLTPLSPIFNLNIVWLEWPNEKYKNLNPFFKWIYKHYSKRARIIAFTMQTKKDLQSLGIKEEIINLIAPAIKDKNSQYQENIFSGLAQKDRSDYRKKFFTIGTITNFSKEQNIETILQALKIALPVVPNLQFIIIGDGPERKSLTWLARRMKIDNLVWFVGEQKYLRKWLESFDLYISSSKSPELKDILDILEAMLSGLPVIGPNQADLDDLVCKNKTGALIEMDNSEMLSQQIIKLQQEKSWRQSLGQMGKSHASTYFSFEKMIEKFKELL